MAPDKVNHLVHTSEKKVHVCVTAWIAAIPFVASGKSFCAYFE